jgi:5-methylcytosine-specific restriction endonuclease McrA
MKKEARKKVWLKYQKHCAYCGKEIEYGDMQVDHIIPKILGGKNKESNYNPSCRRCNHYKRTLPLEKFRTFWLEGLEERLKKIYIVNVALDYGIIELKDWDKKFYFEKQEIKRLNKEEK